MAEQRDEARETITIEQAINRLAAEVEANASDVSRALVHLAKMLADMQRQRDEARKALRKLEQAEAYYRHMHNPDGPFGWSKMRRAGDEARRVLGKEE